MNRRTAFFTFSGIAGASIILPATIFSACKTDDYVPHFLTKNEVELLNEIGDTILPDTPNSPGAKAAKVGNFMDVFVADCNSVERQTGFKQSLVQFIQYCKEKHGKDFIKLSAQERRECLVNLDKASKSASNTPHFFSSIKSWILFSYFSSKEGMTTALRYLPIPGKQMGDFPFKPGDKAWAM